MRELDALLSEVRARENGGDLKGALELLDEAPETAQESGSWHYARGALLSRLGRYAEALPECEQAVEKEPEIAEYRGNLGAVLLELAKAGDRDAVERAGKELELAVRWEPTLPSVHANLGLALMMSGKLPEALAAFDQALALDSKHVPTLYNRAAALSALNRLEDCLAALDAALAIDPTFEAARASREMTLKRLGRG